MKTYPTLENLTEKIPIDQYIEIFSGLPVNSIAVCRCVSKLWSSIVGRPDFTELFLTRSCARPQLLFAYKKAGEWFFFSSPQTQNLDDNSSRIVANYHMRFSVDGFYQIPRSVNGLICLKHQQRLLNGVNETVVVICNPSTGQSLRLPKLNTERCWAKSFFGYDPIGKQFKVLVSTRNGESFLFDSHQILTLKPGNIMLWRTIQCCIPHYSSETDTGICISGVLYYPATVNNSENHYMIACFDVRSEEFRFIRGCHGDLINYNGKLGLFFDSIRTGSIELWYLEDVEKQEWSKPGAEVVKWKWDQLTPTN